MIELFLLASGKPLPILPDSGPGPIQLKFGNEEAGYFGSLPNTDFFSVAEIESSGSSQLSTGTAVNQSVTDLWQKYIFQGKVLYVPKRVLRTGVTWDTLYNCGMVFGIDDNGPYQTTTPTKQSAMVSMLDQLGRTRWFRVRLIRGTVSDGTTDWSETTPDVLDSEYYNTVESTIPTVGHPRKWGNLGTIGGVAATLNSWKIYPEYTITVAGNNNAGFRGRSYKNGTVAWLPCLELMPLGFDPTPNIDYSGPGPQKLIKYDASTDTGYFGIVTQDELFPIDDIESVAAVPFTEGSAVNRDSSNNYHKYYFKGRITFVPIRHIRYGVSWNSIYNAGFIYGEDSNGLYPTVTPTNQLRLLEKPFEGGKYFFKVRSPEGYPTDNVPNPAVASEIRLSEYSTTIERTYPASGVFKPWANSGSPGNVLISKDSLSTSTNMYLSLAGNSTAYQRTFRYKDTILESWLPVLELMPEGYNGLPIIPDNGPGPQLLKEYESTTTSGYFGTVSATDMPSIASIEAAGAKSVGGSANPAAATAPWAKFVRQGKVIYFPTVALRTNTNWNNIYAAGFVYGEDGNGKYPGTPAVNQLRTVDFTDDDGITWRFKIRLASMSSVNPYSHTASGPQATASEYGQAIQNMYSGSPLGWDTYGRIEALGIETNGTYNVSSAMTAATFNAISNWPKDGSAGGKGWLPVLELIGKV